MPLPKPDDLSVIWASIGQATKPAPNKIMTGWTNEIPPYQWHNWYFQRVDKALAHINQQGIAMWDAATTYEGGTSLAKGSDGVVYKAKRSSRGVDPVSPASNLDWEPAFERYGEAAKVNSQLQSLKKDYETLANISNIAMARQNLSVYSKAETDVRYAFKAGAAGQVFAVAPATAGSHAVPRDQLPSLYPRAGAAPGIIALASQAEGYAGTVENKAIAPSVLKALTLYKSQNLADLPDKQLARANLGLASSAVLPENTWLKTASNLADVPNKPAARANLEITDTATLPVGDVMRKSQNLAGLTNVPQARANLGLGTMATANSGDFLTSANNLGDVRDAQAARNNLGLKGCATLDALGLPNGATGLDFQSEQSSSASGWAALPNGLILQWGQGPALYDDRSTIVRLPRQARILNVSVTVMGTFNASIGPGAYMTDQWSNTQFRVSCNWGNWAYPFCWFAITTIYGM
ncbi:tail fiber protein [Pseudomonas phage vB_PaeM_G1]|uniref:Tail fiber protein n=2 Tax=root TaxID=1 RepID=A0A218L3Y2_9CAUD|nr:tail fiber protein [Pseudomonas phage vB_PaeM_G1]ARW57344.1 tail fiber protein [Pseudomonas phage vB_PaeM_G1]